MIDKSSPIPIYFQLKNEILEKIKDNFWKPGDSIDSERQLSQTYDVSRMTIRHAINELVNEGILTRKKGKGTFVCKPTLKQQGMMSFTEMVKKSGRKLKTKVIEFEKLENNNFCSDIFEDNEVYKIVRKRIVDEECIAIESIFISKKYIENISREELEDSLYNFLNKKGYTISNSTSNISAIKITNKIKKYFEKDEEFPILKIVSKNFSLENKILFLEESLYRSDKFVMEVNISKKEGELL